MGAVPERKSAGLASGTVSGEKNKNTKEISSRKNLATSLGNNSREASQKLVAPVKKFVKSAEDNKRSFLERRGNNNNNGLFWTIVLILLILWALFYFTDIWVVGGIIHLLLVIVLVLIILKLLNVI